MWHYARILVQALTRDVPGVRFARIGLLAARLTLIEELDAPASVGLCDIKVADRALTTLPLEILVECLDLA